jgi:hypothetical protein
MPHARFFFDAGSGTVLWAGAPKDQETWRYAVDLRRLPISQALRAELEQLITQYDSSLNWDYPPSPGLWRESQCRRFNEDVRRAVDRLRDELGPAWEIDDEFSELHEDPDLDRYLADPVGFERTSQH